MPGHSHLVTAHRPSDWRAKDGGLASLRAAIDAAADPPLRTVVPYADPLRDNGDGYGPVEEVLHRAFPDRNCSPAMRPFQNDALYPAMIGRLLSGRRHLAGAGDHRERCQVRAGDALASDRSGLTGGL